MKFFSSILLTALLGFIAGLYLPWWSIALVGFGVSVLVNQRPGRSFLAGFIGLFFLWAGLAFFMDLANNSLLSARIGQLLGIGKNALILVLVTGIIGGIVAGMAALSGSLLRRAIR